MNEKVWVSSLVPELENNFAGLNEDGVQVRVCVGRKLPYCCQIHEYDADDNNCPSVSRYETDLLLYDTFKDGRWTPRVVIECKIGRISTHAALTYSAKASTHKHVHPYLRYGFLANEREHWAIPGRLVRHGAYFDFMVTWCATKPTKQEWKTFCELLAQEIQYSRDMQVLLQTSRSSRRTKYTILHRPLVLR
jgi:hypothetical protein